MLKIYCALSAGCTPDRALSVQVPSAAEHCVWACLLQLHSQELRMCVPTRHTATHCNALQRNVAHCKILQNTATVVHTCKTLQHTTTSVSRHWFRFLEGTLLFWPASVATVRTYCHTLQHTSTHINTSVLRLCRCFSVA